MRVWKAYLMRNSGILLLLRPCPQVHLMVKKAEWKNGVGRYLTPWCQTVVMQLESREEVMPRVMFSNGTAIHLKPIVLEKR